MTITGWGRQENEEFGKGGNLWEAQISVMSQKHCKEKYDISGGDIGDRVKKEMPRLFDSTIICAASKVIDS